MGSSIIPAPQAGRMAQGTTSFSPHHDQQGLRDTVLRGGIWFESPQHSSKSVVPTKYSCPTWETVHSFLQHQWPSLSWQFLRSGNFSFGRNWDCCCSYLQAWSCNQKSLKQFSEASTYLMVQFWQSEPWAYSYCSYALMQAVEAPLRQTKQAQHDHHLNSSTISWAEMDGSQWSSLHTRSKVRGEGKSWVQRKNTN